MPSSSHMNTEGNVISPSIISNLNLSDGFSSKNTEFKTKFSARVTAINIENGEIYFERLKGNLGKSLNTNSANKAIPVDIYNIQIPVIGEIVEIIQAPDALSLSNDKGSSNTVNYYGKILNTWNNINTNKTLDPTVPGQANESQLSSINIKNMNKSFLLG